MDAMGCSPPYAFFVDSAPVEWSGLEERDAACAQIKMRQIQRNHGEAALEMPAPEWPAYGV
jgi:hypothetical protein